LITAILHWSNAFWSSLFIQMMRLNHSKFKKKWTTTTASKVLQVSIGIFFRKTRDLQRFDVQIGHGDIGECYRVYVVLSNFLGDHPKIHDL